MDGDPKYSRERIGDVLDVENHLIESKISLFSNELFFTEQKETKNRLEKIWNNLEEGAGKGDIYYLNDYKISNDETIWVKDSHVFMSGWINGHNDKINQIVLLMDEKPFLKSANFSDIPQLMESGHYRNGTKIVGVFHPEGGILEEDMKVIPPNRAWTIVFFSAFLEEGCHKISIGGINENIKFKINKEFILCKK